MQRGFFDVIPAELDQLGSEPAVDVLRQMLWAEVGNVGIPVTDADIPFAVTTGDGGVDAVVKGAMTGPGNGLIFAPITSFQVKTGNYSLGATQPGQIENLLMTPMAIAARRKAEKDINGGSHTLDSISPRIRGCLDQGGTFVTLLFGSDTIDQNDDATEKAIQSFLAEVDPKYADAKVKVWRQSKICGLLQRFPAVSLQIKNLSGFQLMSHRQWASLLTMAPAFVPADNQQAIIETIRETLRDLSISEIHLRILGEPGIGKTRLILEALAKDDLGTLCLYADKGSKIDSQVVGAIRAAPHAKIILVVDECTPEVRSTLVQTFHGQQPSLKIISIYQDVTDSDNSSEYRVLDVPPLPIEQIEAILGTYGVDAAYLRKWAELCDGSPRVAHVIGQNLRNNPADPFRSDGITMIWDRYLAGSGHIDQTSAEYIKRHLIMSALALFKRFGWGPTVRHHADEILTKIIHQLNPNISKAEFIAIIELMISRKILQGDNFLYITPKAFHLKLWQDWWTKYAASVNVNALVPTLSPQMQQWFGNMIEYGQSTEGAKDVVAQLLGPNGLYKDADWLQTREGGQFFFSLSQADPAGAIRTLERTIGSMDRDQLLTLESRRDIVWALDGLALFADLFRPAAKLLLALAEAENERWSNNATGVFAGLFSLGPGDVAPTALSPDQRLPVLTAAIKQNKRRARLALNAFKLALGIQSISRWGGEQPFRMNVPVKRWTPKTYGEWWDAYRLYWTTLRNLIPTLDTDLRAEAVEVLLSRTRELLRVEPLQSEILDTLEDFAEYSDLDKRGILSELELVFNYDSAEYLPDIITRMEALRDILVDASYHSKLLRFAGMDLLHDQFDAEGNEIDKNKPQLLALVEHSLAHPDEFIAELPWLVTPEAKNGFRFGLLLSEYDTERTLWPDILAAFSAAGSNASCYFVGGYLSKLFDRDPAAWEEIVQNMARDEAVVSRLPELVWRSGLTDTIGILLLDLAKNQKFDPRNFHLFSMGRTSARLSYKVFGQWIEFLTSLGTFDAAATALTLSAMAVFAGRELRAEQIAHVIKQESLLAPKDGHADVMISYHWTQLAKRLIQLDPNQEVPVLEALIESMAASGSATAQGGSEGQQFLDKLVAKHPAETWRVVAKDIVPPVETRGWILSRWLRGDMGFGDRDPGPMRHIPWDAIWPWIEEDRDRRAAYVASMAPKDFVPNAWSDSLIREILVRYGDALAVRSAVHSNFWTGGWNGPASVHYATEQANLEAILATEEDANARRWLDEALESTKQNLNRAKVQEEAQGY